MGKATSAAAAAAGAAALTLADTEKEKPPAGLLNVVVVNPDYNKACWGAHKGCCGPMRKVVEACRAMTPPPGSTTWQLTDARCTTPSGCATGYVVGRLTTSPTWRDRMPLGDLGSSGNPHSGGCHRLGNWQESEATALYASCTLCFGAGLPVALKVPQILLLDAVEP